MKKITLITFLLLLFKVEAQNKWEAITPFTSQALERVFCIDSVTGYVGGDSGIVYFTDDAFKTWTNRSVGTERMVKDLFFLDVNTGWVLVDSLSDNVYSQIFFTTNGGRNWVKSIFPVENALLNSMSFTDVENGIMSGEDGEIYLTNDGGISWKMGSRDLHNLSMFPKKKVLMNGRHVFAVGGKIDIAGAVWVSDDYGMNWRTIGLAPEPFIDIIKLDSSNLIGIGGDYEYGSTVCRTSDNGANWEVEYTGFFGMGISIAKRTNKEIWGVINGIDSLLFSSDKGISWQSFPIKDRNLLTDIAFVDSTHGYAIGKQGFLYRYNPDLISVKEKEVISTSGYELSQNYPNPFNGTTNFNYLAPRNGSANIIVYNGLGQVIKKLSNLTCYKGLNTLCLNLDNQKSGIYLVQLILDGIILSKKIILLK